ncbi:HEAT repeat domain-containing protein [Nostoc spongiaeforme FACHB-130]|uniref:HEAT repeat domain-containing protein n=2 Tax=Nostoc TaxID=1177 RepID=A0ABR8FXK4_9NOSO|nr:HEAT repeat domain-containing protein [Nostoc spongiaeforme FACHB-130]
MSELFLGWVATNAVGLLVKTIMTQDFVKEFAQDLAKDYAKDFFKDRFNNVPIALFEKEPLQKAIIKALKEFFQIVEDELKLCQVSAADIKKFAKPLKTFIYNKSVKQILGRAFKDDCNSLNYQELRNIWDELNLPIMPANFNWQSVTQKYIEKCQEILGDSSELRSILLGQRLEEILRFLKENRSITPDFDLPKYLETIRERYISLKLHRLENKGSELRINLWQIFIPQNVREVYQVLPELPKEHLRRLQATQQLDTEFDLEELDRYKRNYVQQPIRSVLDVIQEKRSKNYLVILGDPGSGKSTLLHYLALKWVEETLTLKDFSLPIPLLIELNSYVRDRNEQCNNFLQYYNHAPKCFFHLNQHKLHEQLKAGNALVMFDGLDEIFDSVMRNEVIDSIHRFTNEYPDVQVIVTSRIIGYQPQVLQDAEFRHFILQDLELEQITDFIERWHERTFNVTDKEEKDLKQERLQKAIKESQAIAELAGNPLLLTMMAILNLSQELPRDRPELYNQASRVLLHKWDVERALETDKWAINDKDKQAMLRQVAYTMQTSDAGLAGNVISEDSLINVLTEYLKEELEFEQPKLAARRIIDQLRTRNFMLCFRGADYYGFVHRTFLEYFCAAYFVWRFEKKRNISLTTEVFGKHWDDETWHEVLLLIAGMIEPEYVGEILEYLMVQDGEEKKFINLFLAAKCLVEVRHRSKMRKVADKLLNQLKDLIEYDVWYYYRPIFDDDENRLVREIRTQAVTAIATTWQDDTSKTFLQELANSKDVDSDVRGTAVAQLAQAYKDDTTKTLLLKLAIAKDVDSSVRITAVAQLAKAYKDDFTKTLLLQLATTKDVDSFVRQIAVLQLAQVYKDDSTKTLLLQLATAKDVDKYVRITAVAQLAKAYKDDSTKTLLLQLANAKDVDSSVQRTAVAQLAQAYKDDSTKTLLLKLATAKDVDSDVRVTAVEQLAQAYKDDSTKTLLLQLATAQDVDEYVRVIAVAQLAQAYKDDSTKTFLLQLATAKDVDSSVRRTAVAQLAQAYKDDSTKTFLLQLATAQDDNWYMQETAVEKLAQAYKDDSTKTLLLQLATAQDDNWYKRRTAVAQLAKAYKSQPELFEIYYNCAANDPFQGSHEDFFPNPRRVALEIIIKQYPQHERTLPLLRDRAENDPDEQVREYAQKKLAELEK